MHGLSMKKGIDDYQKKQHNRPAERRHPFAKTLIEVTEPLCDYWDVKTGCLDIQHQPLLLAFEKIYYITAKSFFKIME